MASIGDADAHGLDVVGVGLGAKRKRKTETILFSQELENEKISRFKLCLVKRKLLKKRN
jgi:hypothetical protein